MIMCAWLYLSAVKLHAAHGVTKLSQMPAVRHAWATACLPGPTACLGCCARSSDCWKEMTVMEQEQFEQQMMVSP
jgi:hypothetical protein